MYACHADQKNEQQDATNQAQRNSLD
jgi:hypothetical protein